MSGETAVELHTYMPPMVSGENLDSGPYLAVTRLCPTYLALTEVSENARLKQKPRVGISKIEHN